MWRVSTGASEPASYTFTTNSGESLNCIIISIRDVDTTTPFVTQTSANRASHNTAFPSITTNRDNSLILYISGHPSTATAIPSGIEGPVTQLFQMDGFAHSDSVSWGFKAATGATGTSVISSCSLTTYGGSLVTLAVRAPAAGATLIPAYCSADASVYFDPLHGVTAFRGNSAPASTNTVTTYTGTIAGKAIAAATVSARTDTGINSYRSTAGCTSSTNRTWQGFQAQFAAAKTTMAGKNILVHVKPYLPADIQTLEGIGLSRGCVVGFHTSNGNYKAWHIHGANTSFGVAMVPVIINTGNTTGLIQTTGTLDTASIAGVGMFVSGFVASADMIWTMLWQLDTTTVCGGNATTPIDVPGIVRAVANGHERMSALQQGKNQMLVMQPIQIGDGTNPTYLNVSTAAIEFPQQYNVASSQVFYCSADDVAGVTFYAAAGDTFNISSSTWSSASRFHFKLHTAFSTAVTPNFVGASVIGAGTISLARAVTITSFTINDYSTLDVTALTLVSSNISNPPATSASITTGTTAVLNLCTINVSTLTAGNHWWTGSDPTSIFTNCAFTGGGGHALQITIAGGNSITLTGNTWTGFGADTTTGAALSFTATTGTITVNLSGGTQPTYKSAGATITFVNSKTITFDKLRDNSEVRVYLTGTSTEIAGIENATAGTADNRNFAWSTNAGTVVDYAIHNFISGATVYKSIRVNGYTVPSSNTTIDIAQTRDLNCS